MTTEERTVINLCIQKAERYYGEANIKSEEATFLTRWYWRSIATQFQSLIGEYREMINPIAKG